MQTSLVGAVHTNALQQSDRRVAGAPYLKAVVAQRSSKQSVDAKDEEKGLLGAHTCVEMYL
jgi:hypothetical protein